MNDPNFISKTRRKKQMLGLQDIGATLARLPSDQLARLDLPANLREAVGDCRRMTKHEAVRRQMQLIGRIMRGIDAQAIADQLAALHAPSHRQTALFHRAEKWRAEFLSDPDAVARFALDFPEADPRKLRELAAAAREERLAERSPRRHRELFRAIDAILRSREKGRP